MTTTFTTDLPDANQPVLGNGVEDEVEVDRGTAVTNYGDARLQIRETGTSSWSSSATGFAETTVAYDTLVHQFTGREDGEEYEVRVRAETEHVTGAWTTPVSIVTKFPGATSPKVRLSSHDNVVVTWVDNSDNEDGFKVLVSDDGGSTYTEEADVTSARAEFNLSQSSPTDYTFKVRAYTEHTDADSGTVTETVYQTRVVLNWRDPSGFNQNGFKIYESDDGGSTFTEIADVGSSTFTYETRDLVPNSSDNENFEYKVEAYN